MKSSLVVDIRRFRYFSITLASSAALALTVMSAGAPTTLAQPTDTTYPTESTYAPAEEAPAEVPAYEAPTYEAPSQMPVPAAPEPPIQAPVVTPEAPAPVVTEAPVETQPPVVTEAPVVPEETQAPEVVTTAAPEVTAKPEPRTTAPAATPAPSTTATTQVTAPTPATTTVAPGATTEATAPAGSSAAKTSPSPTASPPEESTADPTLTTDPQSTSEVAPAGGGSTDPSSVTQDAELAAGVTTTPEPQRLEASPQNIEIAQQAAPVREDPPPAPTAEINRLRDLVVPAADPGAAGAPGVAADPAVAANYRVMQWQPNWVQYDQYFRPLIFNPYPEPLQLVYEVAGVPRILLIPPLGRIVTEVRDLGSYNFTAMRLNPLGVPLDVAVGNFFGGGYVPGPGQPPPPPPPPVRTLTDVPVQVKYTNATYRPIVVRKLVDVGPDPSAGGARKVLLDGVTPAWGEWKQNESGVPQFEVYQTQSFPGMEAPGEGPLPGDYDLQLMNDSTPTGLSGKDLTLIIAAVVVAAVGIGAIFLTIFKGRRRRIRH